VVHTISGVPTPQGVAYSSETNKLFVGSDEGTLYVYDGTTFDLITSIDFGDDVDNLRYDAAEKRLYVGTGTKRPAQSGWSTPTFYKYFIISCLDWWRRRESNPRPKMSLVKSLHA
jgi:WD40 repeat protein